MQKIQSVVFPAGNCFLKCKVLCISLCISGSKKEALFYFKQQYIIFKKIWRLTLFPKFHLIYFTSWQVQSFSWNVPVGPTLANSFNLLKPFSIEIHFKWFCKTTSTNEVYYYLMQWTIEVQLYCHQAYFFNTLSKWKRSYKTCTSIL